VADTPRATPPASPGLGESGIVGDVTSSVDLVAGCVPRYASRLHAAAGERHHVASPLGAWLVLALAAPASTGEDRDTLASVLGCSVDTAARAAAGLLADPHPLVAAAAAVWTARGYQGTADLRRWMADLPASVTTGDLPGQGDLDSWAREHTFGLIDRFPVDTGQAYLVLATALATKVSWQMPFQLSAARSLGADSSWTGQLDRVLRTPDGPGARGHMQFIAATPDAGDVIVHAATAVGGLLVVSLGALPDVGAGRVLALAYEIGGRLATGADVERRDLSDLPLGTGPLWVVSEDMATADSCSAVLPAWSASSRLDLTDPVLGFAAAMNSLSPGPDPWDARQAAMARYSRTGFEAAALTAMARSLSARIPAQHRHAELRFGHPYAVVALVQDAGSPWHGLPVFSAWVTEPEDAGGDDPDASATPL
jgi:Serpin (serine protease inhibitor)